MPLNLFTLLSRFGIIRYDPQGSPTTLRSPVASLGNLDEMTPFLPIAVPNGGSPVALNLGGIGCGQYIYIESDQPITVTLAVTGGTATYSAPIPVGIPGGVGGSMLLNATNYTAVSITNNSASIATVYVIMAGTHAAIAIDQGE